MGNEKRIKITIAKTRRTDLPCACCGGFRTEFAVIGNGSTDEDAHAGVHRACIAKLHTKRAQSETTTNAAYVRAEAGFGDGVGE
jgi:hypothetical protein